NFVPNAFIVDALKEYNDPRMFSYFTLSGYKGTAPGDPADINAYKGVPFGFQSNDEVVSAAEGCASVNATYCNAGATYGLITTARTLLVEAEAAVLGWINADPKALYEAGIRASFGFQATYHSDVTKLGGENCIEEYLASEKVALSSDKETALKQIVTQRFLAGFMTDAIESWSDWRRYNIPYMPLTEHQVTEGNYDYPYRMTYDPSEKETNEENTNAAIQQWLGGEDGLWKRVWWDVADNH
ncbi:MAG: SusD/RagB family nutrient-binding outer membrane lipoprotein, partial [Bacteroidaceae bacterium]|nr:SusD/RagB family nutrient-binding outer membrane lipoprotein [Bacteroidaceae bacterium]